MLTKGLFSGILLMRGEPANKNQPLARLMLAGCRKVSQLRPINLKATIKPPRQL
nr:MAG TPA: hypothetical protein [Caudoviricetes sp.]